eukprot:1160176-Pelagomonas_calceolata.AAC.10
MCEQANNFAKGQGSVMTHDPVLTAVSTAVAMWVQMHFNCCAELTCNDLKRKTKRFDLDGWP